ncbi:MAG: aminotransferase class I/II-fold pyridoxal phosphate-dependent enzyme [Lentisphaeria bacterium]
MSDSKFHHSRIASHIAELPKSGIRDFFELVNSMDDVISLGIGEPDFVTPWDIREATIYALEKGHTTYTSNLGLMPLRKACCNYVRDKFGKSYNPASECLITVGVSEGMDLALRAILNPGDEVIYHEPSYVSYAPIVRMAHAIPVPVTTKQEDGFALNAAAVEAAVTDNTKALILNYPNNPTGADISYEQKKEIARVAVEYDLIVITDEIYSELTYRERSQSIATCPDMKERTIFLHGFSKAFAMTGFRIAYACGPGELIEAMMKIHQYSMLCASIVAQEAALEALKRANRVVEKMRIEYEQRRNVIVKRLNGMGLECNMPDGAFYAFPSIRKTGLTANEFATELLEKKNVAVVPGTAFGVCGEGHIRCSYATGLQEIEIAMERIKEFVHESSR